MIETVEAIIAGLKTGQFGNEEAVKQGVVLRLLSELGWPIFDPYVVAPQFPIDGLRADYALCCHAARQPRVLLEVKAVGQSAAGQEQLFGYAFRQGVPLAILTDGGRWEFYLPAAEGVFNDRLVYTLDLTERTPVEIVDRLRRYLTHSAVCSGQAIEAARQDLQSAAQRRRAQTTMPTAWLRLIDDGDELLIDLIADKVAELCGARPEPGMVLTFLTTHLRNVGSAPTVAPVGARPAATAQPDAAPKPQRRAETAVNNGQQVAFQLHGVQHQARDGVDLLIRVFRELIQRDPMFIERFAALPKHGRKRRYVARRREELFPDRQDLAASYARDLAPGWFIGVNLSRASIERVLMLACQVAGLQYGKDLQISL